MLEHDEFFCLVRRIVARVDETFGIFSGHRNHDVQQVEKELPLGKPDVQRAVVLRLHVEPVKLVGEQRHGFVVGSHLLFGATLVLDVGVEIPVKPEHIFMASIQLNKAVEEEFQFLCRADLFAADTFESGFDFLIVQLPLLDGDGDSEVRLGSEIAVKSGNADATGGGDVLQFHGFNGMFCKKLESRFHDFLPPFCHCGCVLCCLFQRYLHKRKSNYQIMGQNFLSVNDFNDSSKFL